MSVIKGSRKRKAVDFDLELFDGSLEQGVPFLEIGIPAATAGRTLNPSDRGVSKAALEGKVALKEMGWEIRWTRKKVTLVRNVP